VARNIGKHGLQSINPGASGSDARDGVRVGGTQHPEAAFGHPGSFEPLVNLGYGGRNIHASLIIENRYGCQYARIDKFKREV
jgi:hypothetical protein